MGLNENLVARQEIMGFISSHPERMSPLPGCVIREV